MINNTIQERETASLQQEAISSVEEELNNLQKQTKKLSTDNNSVGAVI